MPRPAGSSRMLLKVLTPIDHQTVHANAVAQLRGGVFASHRIAQPNQRAVPGQLLMPNTPPIKNKTPPRTPCRKGFRNHSRLSSNQAGKPEIALISMKSFSPNSPPSRPLPLCL